MEGLRNISALYITTKWYSEAVGRPAHLACGQQPSLLGTSRLYLSSNLFAS